ncbi:hypothetical protein GUITHDRAFT_144377 [Guillardia theta CCMP2712]|uniref:Uncharacterized protein n=1 Tax=Guillardia theta (strain CCMP2712) TaxID=905079 RepID=L1IQX9_GUITC|nr:hypothetical protein GUITHDRAFT_144377 [Guillardia theta CCMP2712]EKX38269.1 hypothetical protein GUITHDRAFT_144377 [Guillardia theta CCMP2712]|eukprot:XP_005825249.1 hypothetical protein GUITHDRAFT_144377 [Guillardia theta CCMP2712]
MRAELIACIWIALLRFSGEFVRKGQADACRRGGRRCEDGRERKAIAGMHVSSAEYPQHGDRGDSLRSPFESIDVAGHEEEEESARSRRRIVDVSGALLLFHCMHSLFPCHRLRGGAAMVERPEEQRMMYDEAGGHHKVEEHETSLQLLSILQSGGTAVPDALVDFFARRSEHRRNQTAVQSNRSLLERSNGSRVSRGGEEPDLALRKCFCCHSGKVTYGIAESRWSGEAGWEGAGSLRA